MAIGKLYSIYDGQFLAEVDYKCYDGSRQSWWGELTLMDYVRLNEGDLFVIELEDKRKSRCHLKMRANVAASGFPPRFVYHITGTSPLE